MRINGFSQNRHGSGRHFNRLRLGAAATLALTHETRPCLLDDISCTGARLRITRPLAQAQSVELIFHELRIFSTVKWLRGAECGIQFAVPLELEDMRGMLWITNNRDVYDRICETGHAQEWSEGMR